MIKHESLFQFDFVFLFFLFLFFFVSLNLSGIPLIDGFSLPILAGIRMH